MRSGRMILVGRIQGLYGVKGWVKILSHTDPRENILRYRPWYLDQGEGWSATDITAGRRHGKTVVAHLFGVDDRDQAAALLGTEIAVRRDQLPPPQKGEYYWVDLEGLRVVTETGVALGQISHLFATGANDVIVVQGDKERLIPFVEPDVVREVNFNRRCMIVDWDPEF